MDDRVVIGRSGRVRAQSAAPTGPIKVAKVKRVKNGVRFVNCLLAGFVVSFIPLSIMLPRFYAYVVALVIGVWIFVGSWLVGVE